MTAKETSVITSPPFHQSLEHAEFLAFLTQQQRLLIIQDLDGVCMPLVRDPLRRRMSLDYIKVVKQLQQLQAQFYVLTNGEHLGSRGVNGIVETACTKEGLSPQTQGLYLPGLAAGGVQLQDCYGNVSHPGVSESEMQFLAKVPGYFAERMGQVLSQPHLGLSDDKRQALLNIIVLDNIASPTLNIGSLYEHFQQDVAIYGELQRAAFEITQELLHQAQEAELGNSFFVHLAPNLGRDANGERIKLVQTNPNGCADDYNVDIGTTDFQFMLRGAIKEAGVLVLLNHYYHSLIGEFPLGEDFSARTAPASLAEMQALAEAAFEPELMPTIVGVGDTLTSSWSEHENQYKRGGSDRGFLQLVQNLGVAFARPNAAVFVDSSGGELNRPSVELKSVHDNSLCTEVCGLKGITDKDDELCINVIFPQGYQQYTHFFERLSKAYATGQ